MSVSIHSRIPHFAQVLKSRGVDAFFCTSGVTMGYLAGFHEEGGERLLILALHQDGRVRMLAPALAQTQAERSGITDVHAWTDGENPLNLVKKLEADWGLAQATIGVDDETRAALLIDLQSVMKQTTFVAGQPVLSDLMRVKTAQEIHHLKSAGSAADLSLDPVLSGIKAGATEFEINEALQSEMKNQGGQPAFSIVAAGPNSAEPHHYSDETVVRNGDVLILDFGCSVEGYKSDITRTVAIGGATAEQSNVYDIVFRAHMAAREAIRPGVVAEDIDRAARQVIEDAGYGEFFVHRTGHGLGLRIHEEPYICKGNKHQLEVGNVFSIEPGIYLPGRFGVRIENIVAVTETGHESMNAEPSSTLRVIELG